MSMNPDAAEHAITDVLVCSSMTHTISFATAVIIILFFANNYHFKPFHLLMKSLIITSTTVLSFLCHLISRIRDVVLMVLTIPSPINSSVFF